MKESERIEQLDVHQEDTACAREAMIALPMGTPERTQAFGTYARCVEVLGAFTNYLEMLEKQAAFESNKFVGARPGSGKSTVTMETGTITINAIGEATAIVTMDRKCQTISEED